MKIAKLILFFILIGGIIPSYGFSFDNSGCSQQKEISTCFQKKLNETNNFKLLDYAFLDIEEELSSDEDYHDSQKNNSLVARKPIILHFFSSKLLHYTTNHEDKLSIVQYILNGNLPPIYITLRVLRI
ncbi:hypothetical protein [Flavobacterium myungsuense]|uniref:Uncharacterized protein n=1 Tax=Flavobacterium myungsuense TaxID=651823 RepID=A0ABW3J476_9FLAO